MIIQSTQALSPFRPVVSSESGSARMLERGRQSIAGGDSSSMRVLPYHLPLVAQRGKGCRVWDVDGNEYLDLNMAYGPLLFGHCPQHVIDSVTRQISQFGSQLGFPTEITIRVAEKIKQLFPSIELLRFANSGTEACASAVRLARTATGRRKLIMFEGHYHGWSEAVFNRYHAPLEMLSDEGFGPGIPGTNGMTDAIQDVIVCQWNDLETFERCLKKHGHEVAAVIMEPVVGNANLLLPQEGYLQRVREMAHDNGSLLIFDEVITGLRAAAGGAQEYFGVKPDITVLSKAVGGGYPVGCFGASRQLMELITGGKMFHGGVFSGNAIVMAAADAVLTKVLAEKEAIYKHLNAVTTQLANGLTEIFNRFNVPHEVNHIGSLLGIIVTETEGPKITNYRQLRRQGRFESYIKFQQYMQQMGVYFHPNMFETLFLSTAHTTVDVSEALSMFEDGVQECLVR